MAPEAERTSPSHGNKKQKVVEKTLANWVKKRQLDALPISDDDLRMEARKYATTLTEVDSTNHVDDPAWLERFKSKYLSGKPRNEKSRSSSKASHAALASSPPLGWDATPLSAGHESCSSRSPVSGFDEGSLWGHGHSQSTTSYESLVTDTGFNTDHKGSATMGLFQTSPSDPNLTMPAPRVSKPHKSAPAKLKRRQTMPNVGVDDKAHENMVQQHVSSSAVAAGSAMDISPAAVASALDHTACSPVLTNHATFVKNASTDRNNPSYVIYPQNAISLATDISPSIGCATTPPSISSPSIAPSRDEAFAASETIQKFLRCQPSSSFDNQSYQAMHNLMTVLMLRLESQTHINGTFVMPENERGDGTAPLGRKRSEHSLS